MLCCGLVTHFILVRFVLVFGYHIYLTLRDLCFSLYIGTAHYSILQFPVFFYSLFYMFCLHYVLQVPTLQVLDGPTQPANIGPQDVPPPPTSPKDPI